MWKLAFKPPLVALKCISPHRKCLIDFLRTLTEKVIGDKMAPQCPQDGPLLCPVFFLIQDYWKWLHFKKGGMVFPTLGLVTITPLLQAGELGQTDTQTDGRTLPILLSPCFAVDKYCFKCFCQSCSEEHALCHLIMFLLKTYDVK